jgi:hypothetical protein
MEGHDMATLRLIEAREVDAALVADLTRERGALVFCSVAQADDIWNMQAARRREMASDDAHPLEIDGVRFASVARWPAGYFAVRHP